MGNLTLNDELLALGERYAEKETLLVEKWKAEHAGFVGFAEINSPELTMLWKELKQEYAEILKKYNKLNSSV